ncbi:hypothetical protein C8R44DRAFT_888624 [Mycena epipterygia]|nr:hypothetical protein C8R44DRAFT_888624 [Mycena epipterygia]
MSLFDDIVLRSSTSKPTLINPGPPGGDAPADHAIDLSFSAAGNSNQQHHLCSSVSPDLLNIINCEDVSECVTGDLHEPVHRTSDSRTIFLTPSFVSQQYLDLCPPYKALLAG